MRRTLLTLNIVGSALTSIAYPKALTGSLSCVLMKVTVLLYSVVLWRSLTPGRQKHGLWLCVVSVVVPRNVNSVKLNSELEIGRLLMWMRPLLRR